MKRIPSILCLIAVLLILLAQGVSARDTTVVLSYTMFQDDVLRLGNLDGWVFQYGDDSTWADPDLDTSEWLVKRPSLMTVDSLENDGSKIQLWMRLRFQIDSTLMNRPLFLRSGNRGAIEVYINGKLENTYGVYSEDPDQFEFFDPTYRIPDPLKTTLIPGETYVLAVRLVDFDLLRLHKRFGFKPTINPNIRLTGEHEFIRMQTVGKNTSNFSVLWMSALSLITLLLILLYLSNRTDRVIRDILVFVMLLSLVTWLNNFQYLFALNAFTERLMMIALITTIPIMLGWIPYVIGSVLIKNQPRWLFYFLITYVFFALLLFVTSISVPDAYQQIFFTILGFAFLIQIGILFYATLLIVLMGRHEMTRLKMLVIAALVVDLFLLVGFLPMVGIVYNTNDSFGALMHASFMYLIMPVTLMIYISIRYADYVRGLQEKVIQVEELSEKNLQAEKEKQKLMEVRREELEKEVTRRTKDLKKSLEDLKAAQAQLVQSEKMASLGQLTAGIAHEIKNPLNFVNNFSSVSVELVDELLDDIESLNSDLQANIDAMAAESNSKFKIQNSKLNLDDIKSNLQKINEHGTRADKIVKGMLMHSRGKSGDFQNIKINDLVTEYVNLAYHGMRAADPSFSVNIKTNLDSAVGSMNVVPQDLSRAILNVVNNACYAVNDKKKSSGTSDDYKPVVTVSTKNEKNGVLISIHDNGTGIPDDVREKIFEPFYTTKPTGEGTGLGLSMTYDIVVHTMGGKLDILTKSGEFTEFIIHLPDK